MFDPPLLFSLTSGLPDAALLALKEGARVGDSGEKCASRVSVPCGDVQVPQESLWLISVGLGFLCSGSLGPVGASNFPGDSCLVQVITHNQAGQRGLSFGQ